MKVTVCTWDPQHTLDLVEDQQVALRDGTIAALVRKHGKGTGALQKALAKAKLVSVVKTDVGEVCCADCGALVETVLSREGIKDRVDAVRDVAQNFNKAIERTRAAR